MTAISEEDQRAKMKFINAFFDDLDDKTAYLVEMHKSGRRDEAQILCSCYVDWLASALYWPVELNNYNYTRVLKEYGGEIFGYIHPMMLDIAFGRLSERSDKWKAMYGCISVKLKAAERRLHTEDELLELFTPLLSRSDKDKISKQMWRGTFAAIVYDRFRIPAVHNFGPWDGITFTGTTFQGKPVPPIDFERYHQSLPFDTEGRETAFSVERHPRCRERRGTRPKVEN